jgi:hypothetical protein
MTASSQLKQRHPKKVADHTGPAIAILLVKAHGPLQRLRGVKGDVRATAGPHVLLRGVEQLLRDTPPLPLGQDSHAADVPFIGRNTRAGDGPDNLAGLRRRHENGHALESLLHELTIERGVAETFCGVLTAIGGERGMKAIDDGAGIIDCCLAYDHGATRSATRRWDGVTPLSMPDTSRSRCR